MQILDQKVLFEGKVEESILVHSFEEYKKLGGKRDMLDLYAFIKERAKREESNYISAMDQALSGLEVSDDYLRKQRLRAQANWYLLHLWFSKPLRTVDFSTFDLSEFNRL
jgi:hypothetical protein